MIIIGIMGIVILYAAFDFFVPKKKAPVSVGTSQTAPLEAFVTEITTSMAKEGNEKVSALIFSRAEKEWRRDPFLDAKSYRAWTRAQAPAKAEGGAAAPKIEFRYTGYLEANGERVAIVNGAECGEGDETEIKGYVIKKISPTRVTIENQFNGTVQNISLQE
ncbi:MAG: hypothetical protein QM278_06840 [Pseudomonadota bacterium]|nr:hypothetical protein [Pseudomonadota bacterium]